MFPKAILLKEAHIPPYFIVEEERISPLFISSFTFEKLSLSSLKSTIPSLPMFDFNKISKCPSPFKSLETISLIWAVFTAKETRVGGTFMSLKLPDILSFPPMDGMFNSLCAWRAPKSELNGFPHLSGSFSSLSKYSWKVSLTFL